MKSSFKLLGVLRDRNPISDSILLYDGDICGVPLYKEPADLFDTDFVQRKIPLSELLSIESNEALDNLIKEISHIDRLVIEVDFKPESNKILEEFYSKRLLQICYQLKRFVPSLFIDDYSLYMLLVKDIH